MTGAAAKNISSSAAPHSGDFFVFFAANLAHFVHNAEYIAFYPGLPSWLTRETVYLAWLAGAGVGWAGWRLSRTGLKSLGVALMAVYGAWGIYGLAHYTLALCSAHTLIANLSIGFEVATGLTLMLVCANHLARDRHRLRHPHL